MNKPTLAAIGVFSVLLIAFAATREKAVSVGVMKFEALTLTAAEIDSVTVTGTNGAKLERGANGWTVADPARPELKFAADEAQVQSVLSALADFKAPDFVSDKTDKHPEYEVTAEKGTTVVATAGGKTLSLVLGKASKSGGTYVRQLAGSAVFVTSSPVSFQLKRTVTAWRNKSIATAPLAELARVEVVRVDGESFVLEAAEAGAWTLKSPAPQGFRFDATAAQRLVGQLTSLAAQDFLSGEGDFSSAQKFVLTTKAGKSVTVWLSLAKQQDGTLPLKVDGDAQRYLVPSWVAQQLDQPLDGLRDLSLLAFDVAKATRLSIIAGGKKTVVAKVGEGWNLVEPTTPPAGVAFDANQVAVKLNALKTVRAARRVDVSAAKAGFTSPTTQLEVTVEGKPVKLVFGAETGSNSEVYVKGAVDDAVYVIAAAQRAQWGTGAALFNKPQPPPDFGGAGQINGLEQLPPELRAKLMEQLRQQRN